MEKQVFKKVYEREVPFQKVKNDEEESFSTIKNKQN